MEAQNSIGIGIGTQEAGRFFSEFNSAFSALVRSIRGILDAEGVVALTQSHLGKIFGVFEIYINLLKGLACSDFPSMYKVIAEKGISGTREEREVFQNSVEAFFESEKVWDTLLERIDTEMATDAQVEAAAGSEIGVLGNVDHGKIQIENFEKGEEVSLESICQSNYRTWFVFLRHFA